MARVQGRFSREFNRRRRYLGRLWQSRYKARIVQDENHLKSVIAYVHLNPVAAGMVCDPLDYAQSGHGEILGLREPCLCDVGEALLCFGEKPDEARMIYQDWMRSVAEERWFRAGVRNLPWWRTVDDDEQTLPKMHAPSHAEDYSGQPLEPEEHNRPAISQVLNIFEDELEIGIGQIAGRSRKRLLSWHRCLFVTYSVSWLGHSAKKVAGVIDKSPGSVSRWLSEGLELQRSDPDFRLRLSQVAERVNAENQCNVGLT